MKLIYQSAFISLLFIHIAAFVFAQTGTIKGVVRDGETKETIIGAGVKIAGTNQAVPTNEAGLFELSKLEPGTYSLAVTYFGYKNLIVSDVKIEADKQISLELEIQPSNEEIGEVVIKATRLTNTQTAVITEVRKALQVVSGVSQQQIKLSQDRDAAQVMSRVPGLTIVDNRFVMVRGIPERYNQVLLNNVIAPSTEIDRRTFSFDLVPSGVLDRMMIYKSGSPENPGDFAGGLIKIYTSNVTDENFTTFSLGTNVRLNTTFKPYIYSRTSSTDFLGFDGGERKLPSDFPSWQTLKNATNNDPIRVEAPKTLNNDLSYKQATAIPDINFGVGLGRSWHFADNKRLSTLTTLNYSQSYQSYQRDFMRYFEDDGDTDISLRFKYVDDSYEKENRIGVLSNWIFVFNPYNKIEFKNLFNQIGENRTVIRRGEDFNQQVGLLRENYMYDYRARSVYTGQLQGSHRFGAGKSSLDWVLGYNYLGDNQPDLRQFRTIEDANNRGNYLMITPSGSNPYEVGRFFGKLAESSFDNNANYELNLGDREDENPTLLKVGYLVNYRKRDFTSRYFSYNTGPGVAADELNRLVSLPLDQMFVDENFNINGFRATEGTSPMNSYNASNFLTAGYAGIVLPLKDFHISGGVRVEYNILKLNSADNANLPIVSDNRVLSPLPYLNIDYSLSEKSVLRAAYGRTVNRPEFREIAPFQFYDFEYDFNRYGEPDLKTATINNIDLRYEFYPRSGETLSIGGFYKQFTDPIETTVLPQGETVAFSYANATGGAYNYGVEIEIRKSLKDLTASGFIDKLSMNVNASLIRSEVDLGAGVIGQDQKRSLQGQSPYIINAMLSYDDQERGLQVSGAYNVFGSRIFAIGNLSLPAIYELPRNALDVTFSKSFKNNMTLKVGVQDLLNAPYRFYQDTNRNQKISTSEDNLAFGYRRGALITTGLSYTIK